MNEIRGPVSIPASGNYEIFSVHHMTVSPPSRGALDAASYPSLCESACFKWIDGCSSVDSELILPGYIAAQNARQL